MLGSFKKELLILVVSFQIFQHLNLDSIWVQRSSTNYMVHEIPLTSSNHSDPTCLKRKPSNICNMQLFWSDGNQSDGDRPARKDILCAMRAITVASITIKQDQTISKKQGWSSWSHSENILWRPKNHSGNLVWLNFLYDLDVRMTFSCQIGRLSACHGTVAALPELLRAPAPKSQSDPLRHKPHRSCFEVLDDLLQIHLRVWTCLKNFIKKWDTMGKLWKTMGRYVISAEHLLVWVANLHLLEDREDRAKQHLVLAREKLRTASRYNGSVSFPIFPGKYHKHREQ